MELDAIHAAQSIRFSEARLQALSSRIRASRARPLDRLAIEELTALRFAATRLSRRLRLLAMAKGPQHTVDLLDPVRELESELRDARAEAVRRGARVGLQLDQLEHVSRKINFIDALASLVEDGIDAGANHLTLATRHHKGRLELCLRTDAQPDSTSFGVFMLGLLLPPDALELDQAPGLTLLSVFAQPAELAPLSARGTERWTAPSPSRL